MFKPSCPECHQKLAASDMNLSEGVALCPSCGSLTRLGDLPEKLKELFGVSTDTGDWSNTVNELWREVPRGCTVKGSRSDINVTATTRAYGSAVAMLFFGVFWNSIVSVFLAAALSGVWGYFFGKLPAWVPIAGGSKQSPMPLGISIFLLVFLIPFIAIGLGLIYGVIMSLFGSVNLRVRYEQASVSTGVGPFRKTRRFDVNNVTNVCLAEKPVKFKNNSSNKPTRSVLIKGLKEIHVGNGLSETRMKWFGSVAMLLLMEPRQQDVDDLLRAGQQSSRMS